MKRHDVAKVVLLGVGGVQAPDAEWIGAAARKYPDRVIRGAELLAQIQRVHGDNYGVYGPARCGTSCAEKASR